MFAWELRRYITNVLDGRDETILQMSKDIRGRCREMITDLNITEKNFQSTLEGICEHLFSQKCTTGYYTTLLIFCMELDSIHKEKSSWYSRDILVETLIDILLKTERTRKRHYFGYILGCSILFIITTNIYLCCHK